jgi:hypothetical protein
MPSAARSRPPKEIYMRAPTILLLAASAPLLACGNGPANGTTTEPTSSVSSPDVVTNVSVPIDLLVFVPCANGGAGELVELSGDLHMLSTFTINGNNVSGLFHDQPQGVDGVGLVTGDKYQGTGVTESEFKASLQNGQFETTFVNNFRIIGQGPGNNFLIHENTHVTFNAKGTLTSIHDNFNGVECK